MAAKSGEKAKYCHLLPAGCQGDGKKKPFKYKRFRSVATVATVFNKV